MLPSYKDSQNKLENEINSRLNSRLWSVSTASSVYEKLRLKRRRQLFRALPMGLAAAAASVMLIFTFMTDTIINNDILYETFVSDQITGTYLQAAGYDDITQSGITFEDSLYSNETDFIISETLASR